MSQKVAYLTIDDAPSEDMALKVDFLKARGILAIFFCRGDYLEIRPQAAIDAIHQGFVIANHSYNHPRFSTLSLPACYEQIQRTEAIVERIYAEAEVTQPAKLFRFPYGDKGTMTNDNVLISPGLEGAVRKEAIQAFLRQAGYYQPAFEGITYQYYRKAGLLADRDWHWTYDVVEWSVFSDWHLHGIDSLEKVFARMDEDVPEGGRGLNDPASEEIILTHDHHESTDIFFPIIERLLEKGLVFKLPVLSQ
jgi:peptidoglycan/xylan/chitin deacetylase (PgdA/CDA1 family)